MIGIHVLNSLSCDITTHFVAKTNVSDGTREYKCLKNRGPGMQYGVGRAVSFPATIRRR